MSEGKECARGKEGRAHAHARAHTPPHKHTKKLLDVAATEILNSSCNINKRFPSSSTVNERAERERETCKAARTTLRGKQPY